MGARAPTAATGWSCPGPSLTVEGGVAVHLECWPGWEWRLNWTRLPAPRPKVCRLWCRNCRQWKAPGGSPGAGRCSCWWLPDAPALGSRQPSWCIDSQSPWSSPGSWSRTRGPQWTTRDHLQPLNPQQSQFDAGLREAGTVLSHTLVNSLIFRAIPEMIRASGLQHLSILQPHHMRGRLTLGLAGEHGCSPSQPGDGLGVLDKLCWGLHHQPDLGPSPHPGAGPFGRVDIKMPEHWTVTSEMMKFPMPGTWVPSTLMGCSCRGLQDTMGAVTHSSTAVWCTVRVSLSGPTRTVGSLQALEPKPVTVKMPLSLDRRLVIWSTLLGCSMYLSSSVSLGTLFFSQVMKGLGSTWIWHWKRNTLPSSPSVA